MSTAWRYGLIRTVPENDARWSTETFIHEIFFDRETGAIVGWTEAPVTFGHLSESSKNDQSNITITAALQDAIDDIASYPQPVMIVKGGKGWPGDGYSLSTQPFLMPLENESDMSTTPLIP